MAVIKDEVSIQYAYGKFGIHSRQTKDLIFKFESPQQEKISKKQKNMIENRY